jgi:hypothetical protein
VPSRDVWLQSSGGPSPFGGPGPGRVLVDLVGVSKVALLSAGLLINL